MIPAELLHRTWSYLNEESGAPVVARRTPGGHGLTASVVADLGGWLTERLTYAQRRPVPTPGRPGDVTWPTVRDGVLPQRHGSPPDVTWSIPQQQTTQNAPTELQERLLDLAREMPGVSVSASRISVPGARALNLDGAPGDWQAFLVPSVSEFAHLHPSEDGSLHLALPADHAADLVAKGWGRAHPLAGTRLTPGFVMVFGPRDDEELITVASIVQMSHAYASGTSSTTEQK